jgi:D-3-phosphoglycerate dehydrogenase
MMLNERIRFDTEIRERGYEPVWASPRQFLTAAQCLQLVGGIDGWLAGDDRITREVLEKALPRLKVISKWGTGLDSIDLVAARELGVPVLNSPGAFATAVAEVAIGYMLVLARHLGSIDRSVRRGEWPKPRGRELAGAVLGLIGFGAIGRHIGRLGAAFGMRVMFSDPAVNDPVDLGTTAAPPATLAEIASESDFVCLACSLNEGNRALVDGAFLDRMKRSAYLVNVARGPVVDQPALVQALAAGRIAGAGLDVFAVEPLEAGNPLLDMDNVVLGSHNANNAAGAVEAVHRSTLDNLARHLS